MAFAARWILHRE